MDLNTIGGIVAGTVVMMVLGFLWYGPLFGAMWMTARGVSADQITDTTTPIVISVVGALVASIAMAILLWVSNAHGAGAGLHIGIIGGVGLVATSQVTNAAYEGRNWTVTGLFIGYQVVGLALVGAIQGTLR